MILKRYFFLLTFIIFYTHLQSQHLDFYREDLSFKIKDNYFYVNGDYYFCNNDKDSINQVLFYPFPTDSLYGTVDSIKIIDLKKQSNLDYKTGNDGVFFIVKLNPYGVNKYNIRYRHKLLGKKAEYILLTTKQWRKPFEQVNYKLIVDDTINIQSISYKPDSSSTTNNKTTYIWHRENFMPDNNMIIVFK